MAGTLDFYDSLEVRLRNDVLPPGETYSSMLDRLAGATDEAVAAARAAPAWQSTVEAVAAARAAPE